MATVDVKNLFDLNKGILFEHELATNELWLHYLFIDFRDRIHDEIEDASGDPEESEQLLTRIKKSIAWHEKRQNKVNLYKKMAVKCITLQNQIDKLKAQKLELELSPYPGPLFLATQRDFIKHGGKA